MLARNAEDVGRIVKSRRNAIGMTQQKLATIIGVNRRWVGDLEAGHPRAELALVLDVLDAVGALADVVDNPGSASSPSGLASPSKGLALPKLTEAQRTAIQRADALRDPLALSAEQRKAILGLASRVVSNGTATAGGADDD